MTQPVQPPAFQPLQRGEGPSSDDFLTDEEIRTRELAKITSLRTDTNVKARRLQIMQEAKQLTEEANAITRDRR